MNNKREVPNSSAGSHGKTSDVKAELNLQEQKMPLGFLKHRRRWPNNPAGRDWKASKRNFFFLKRTPPFPKTRLNPTPLHQPLHPHPLHPSPITRLAALSLTPLVVARWRVTNSQICACAVIENSPLLPSVLRLTNSRVINSTFIKTRLECSKQFSLHYQYRRLFGGWHWMSALWIK